ncbi:DUF975 family protein [Clostridioides mangenotii]|uniref:DUF975 family protein n=1 Tax=Metaclostridioides mangenotii TaxID=1540 RepID=UPI00214A1C5A|nr:DUF975 family protein [Clostridioides mangenotii]MCR1954313.1 DUF975 family protein [Clostridioides mangenotii]
MVSNSVLKERAKSQLKGHWGSAIFVAFLTSLVFFMTESILESEATSSIILFLLLQLFIAAPLYVGKIKFLLDLAQDKNPKISEIAFGYKNLTKSMLLGIVLFVGYLAVGLLFSMFGYIIFEFTNVNVFTLIIGIFLGIGLIILFYYIVVLFSMSYYVFCEDPDMHIFECIKRGVNLMKGHVMEFFVLGLSFLGWYILPIAIGLIIYLIYCIFNVLGIIFILSLIAILCAVPYMLWLSIYMEVTYINFYLELNSFEIE